MGREILLTQGLVALVVHEDYERVMAAGKWHAHRDGKTFYARRAISRSTHVNLHAFLTGWLRVDHINGDGLDNRRANLRQATHGQNVQNRRRSSANTSGYKGVTWHKQARKWQAAIKADRRTYYLGIYGSPELAALAYDEAARHHHGEFARVNFPLPGERGAS